LTSTITVTLKDANGNPISGKTITLGAGSGSSTITTLSGTTNASGQATFAVKDSTPQAVIYTATDTSDALVITQHATVTFTGVASGSKSTVSASPASVTANGGSFSTVTVTLNDANGNPISGKAISLSAGSGISTITVGSGTTNSNGQATFTVSDTTAQAVIYTATDTSDSLVITQTATVTFTAGTVAGWNSRVSASPTTVVANGAATSTITVTVFDIYSNPIAGDAITLSAGSGSSVITTVSGTTNASGVATFTVTDTHAQSVTYSATDVTPNPDVVITQTAAVAFVAGPASATTSTVVPSPTSVTANGSNSSTVTVTVLDAFGNPNASDGVTLTASGGNSVIATSPSTTNSLGVATFRVTDTHAQSVTYTARDTTDSVTITQTAAVTFVAGPANKLVIITLPVSGAHSSSSSLGPITVQLQDAFGNPVNASGSGIALTLASSAGTPRFSATSGGTAITTVTIASGSSSVNFYYGNSSVVSALITVSSSGLTGATQTETTT
jgi:hypothetical protein